MFEKEVLYSFGLIAVLLLGYLYFRIFHRYMKCWLIARFAGVPLTIGQVLHLMMLQIPPEEVINPLILTTQMQLPVTLENLWMHYLAGGNCIAVVEGMAVAEKAGIPLSWEQAVGIDLKGGNVANEMLKQAKLLNKQDRIMDVRKPDIRVD